MVNKKQRRARLSALRHSRKLHRRRGGGADITRVSTANRHASTIQHTGSQREATGGALILTALFAEIVSFVVFFLAWWPTSAYTAAVWAALLAGAGFVSFWTGIILSGSNASTPAWDGVSMIAYTASITVMFAVGALRHSWWQGVLAGIAMLAIGFIAALRMTPLQQQPENDER